VIEVEGSGGEAGPDDSDREEEPVEGELIGRDDLEEVVFEAVQASVRYSGPIPPPQAFREYEDALPGAADRILTLAERQAAHRMQLERRQLDWMHRHLSRGQVFGFLIVVLGFVLGYLLAINDKPVWGLATSISSLALIVGAFVYGRVSDRRALPPPDEQEPDDDEPDDDEPER
jgi:uncharacterized membrane protein